MKNISNYKYQQKMEQRDASVLSDRQEVRRDKQILKNIESKISDKIWWRSLTNKQKERVLRSYKFEIWESTRQNLNPEHMFHRFEENMKDEFPNTEKIRDLKINFIANLET